MTQDMYGLPVTNASEAAMQGINDFIHGFIAFEPKATNVMGAAANAPDCCLINTYTAMLWMLLEAPIAPEKALPFLRKAESTMATSTLREQMMTRAIRAWVDGDVPTCVSTCEEILIEHPRDMVALKLGQYHTFNAGDFPSMLRLALKVMPAADDIPYAHGMVAFGYEECHLLDDAETSARRAMELRHDEPWAHHALAHIFLTRGQTAEGAAFLESVADTWGNLNSFMHSHNWWHLALFYISAGREADVVSAYDNHVWGLAKDYSQDQVGAASLLARMEFAGINVGDRWADVASHIAKRGPDTVSPFLTLQYLYALGRTDRGEAEVLLEAIEQRAEDESQFDHLVWRDVAIWAAHGIAAHAAGDWDDAIRFLGKALPRMAECGGSHAQRDLFEQIHLDALMQSGQASKAQQVLEMRRTFDPGGVPLNMLLADAYHKTGLPDQAFVAQKRANASRAALAK
ncbi:MAG: tetratricopeptide repeat protein [Ascidiaceihabitans sp.]|nr:tetratricopeptide repeat protein [Ascidiaceihabitans sp.]